MQEMCLPEKTYYVYLHRKLSNNEIFYVGAGKGKRISVKSRRSKYWQYIVAKHGITTEKIAECLSFEESRLLEIITIKNLTQSGLMLCNMTAGGEGLNGLFHSAETKEKIRKSNIGKNSGKKASAETRLKMSLSHIGSTRTDATKARMSAWQKGIPKLKPAHNKGVPMSECQKQKLKKPKTQQHKDLLSRLAIERIASTPIDKRPSPPRSDGANNPRADHRVYKFERGLVENIIGTRVEFFEITGIKPNKLFGSKPSKTLKGWTVQDS